MIGRKPPRTQDETSLLRGFDDYDLSLGDVMRGERATLNKSLLDVQRELRIKAPYIVAIENADPAVFDTPGFIAGYVRSYSRYLGLDPDWAFQKFCEESGFTGVHGMQPEARAARKVPAARADTARGKRREIDPLFASATALMPQRQSVFDGFNAGALGSLLVLAGLLGGLGYGGYSILQEVQRVTLAPAEVAPGASTVLLDPLSAAALTDPALRSTDDVQTPTTEALNQIYRPEALEVPILTARDGPISIIDPDTVGIWRAPPVPGGVQVADSGPAAPTPVQVLEPPPPVVAIVAVNPAWVRVRAADNSILLERILDAGETFVLPNTEAPATLRAGNSGDVYFLVDGQTFGPAGAPGSVASNVVLSRDTLSETYALADLDADPGLREAIATAEAQIIGAPQDNAPLQ
jgi:hypothetical protein